MATTKPNEAPLGTRVLWVGLVGALICVSVPAVCAQATQTAHAESQQNAVENADLPSDYVVGVEDHLAIVFWKDEDMSAEVTVRPDGIITLPLIGDVRVIGQSPAALRLQIQREAAKYVTDPSVTVIVKQVNSRKVFITGQVTRPGEYPLNAARNVTQIIALAGGLTEWADSKNITIMRGSGNHTTVFKFNYRDVERGKNFSQNIQLQPGDTVIVP